MMEFHCSECGAIIENEKQLCSNCLRKNTNIKKYGTPFPNSFSSKNFKNKMKELYGNEYALQNKQLEKKRKRTMMERYGCEHNWSGEGELRKNGLKTNLLKYDSIHPLQNKEIKKKSIKKTLIKTYNSFLNFEKIRPLFSIEDYKKKSEKYELFEWECKTCSNKFYYPYANGYIPKCKICEPTIYNKKHSNKEKEVLDFIKSLNVLCIENDRTIIHPYEIDIYIPSKKLAIEFNGDFWHSEEMGKDSFYHLNKTKMCEEKGVELIHIYEWEWDKNFLFLTNLIKNKIHNIKINHTEEKIIHESKYGKFDDENYIILEEIEPEFIVLNKNKIWDCGKKIYVKRAYLK